MEIEINRSDKTFMPTVEWMRERYSEMNSILFGNSLGDCSFKIFTKGKGSQGRTLGYYTMQGSNLKCDRYTRRMYRLDFYGGKDTIDSNNFVKLCHPLIALNGNYHGTELGFLTTLVHEMCHYYTYMQGYAPSQAHGPEFRRIAEYVTSMSDGLFTIQRLASAEHMENLELSDEMKERRARREANKKASLYAVFEYKVNGEIRMTTTSSLSLIEEICNFNRRNSNEIRKFVLCNDSRFIELIYSMGYRKNMRSWRYYNVENAKWLIILDDMNKQTIHNPLDVKNIKTESIRKRYYDEIINEVINHFITEREDNDDMCDIIPGMNLGLKSPFEIY